jgi:hypothetical protein
MNARLIFAALLLLLAGTAKAVPITLQLVEITYESSTTGGELVLGSPAFPGECLSCVGGSGTTSLAIVDGINVQLLNVAWSVGDPQVFSLSFDAGFTITGTSVALLKSSVVCTPSLDGNCSGMFTGFGMPFDLTGQGGNGLTCVSCAVDVLFDGSHLSVAISKALTSANDSDFQVYRLNYALIPVAESAPLVLLLTALGGLVLMRRRRQDAVIPRAGSPA